MLKSDAGVLAEEIKKYKDKCFDLENALCGSREEVKKQVFEKLAAVLKQDEANETLKKQVHALKVVMSLISPLVQQQEEKK